MNAYDSRSRYGLVTQSGRLLEMVEGPTDPPSDERTWVCVGEKAELTSEGIQALYEAILEAVLLDSQGETEGHIEPLPFEVN